MEDGGWLSWANENKSFFTSAKNIVILGEQNLPQTLDETLLFSQRFMKKINRVNRTMR
jgi:hypothetical protein